MIEQQNFDPSEHLDTPLPVYPARPWLITFADLICVLLSFFVLLANVSKVEQQKVRDAIHSLGESLAFGTPGDAGRLGPPPEGEAFAGVEAVRTRLASQILTAFPGVAMQNIPARNELRFALPAAEVLAGSDVKASAKSVLTAVAAALHRESPGFRFEAEAAAGAGTDATATALAIGRASLVARTLVDTGAPKASVAAVVDRGNPEEMRFTIRAVAEDAPRIDFRRLVPAP